MAYQDIFVHILALLSRGLKYFVDRLQQYLDEAMYVSDIDVQQAAIFIRTKEILH